MGRAAPTSAEVEAPPGLEIRLRDVPFSSLFETLRRGTSLVSAKVGLALTLPKGVYRARDPLSFAFGILPADLYRFSDVSNPGKAGGGGASLEEALASTLGETVERYCIQVYDRRRMVAGSYRELEPHAVAPDELRLHSRAQVESCRRRDPRSRLRYFDEDTRLSWAWAWSLTQRRPRLVPADLVYVGYRGDDGEPQIAVNASSGFAAGITLEEAILSGLYEIIERDAATLSWLHERVGREIEVDDPALLRRLATDFQADHPDTALAFYDLTLDVGVPTVFSVMRRPAEIGPVLAIAAATRLDPRAAVRKCLSEMGQSLPYFRFLSRQLRDWEPREDHGDLTAFDLHCMYYLKLPERVAEALAFCDRAPGRVALSTMPDRSTGSPLGDLERAIEAVEACGLEVIVADISTADVREAGFLVVRVLVPGMLPLHGNHAFPYLGVRRLDEVPRRLGWPARPDLNPRPHPYP